MAVGRGGGETVSGQVSGTCRLHADRCSGRHRRNGPGWGVVCSSLRQIPERRGAGGGGPEAGEGLSLAQPQTVPCGVGVGTGTALAAG